MALVSELVTKVTADTSSFTSAMKGVVGAASAAATAVVVAVDRITDRIDNMGKTAQKLGIDLEAFQGLKFAADLANVPIERLQSGMIKLAKSVDDAARGGKEASATFQRLGLNASELQALSLDQQYMRISDAINDVSNKNEQLAISMQIFGKSGADQLLLIRENASGLIDEFNSLNLTISENQRAQAEAFQDTKTRMMTVVSGFSSQVAVELSSAFTIMMDEITKSITGVDDLRGAARNLASTLVGVVNVGVQSFDIFLTVLDNVKNRIDQVITGIGNALQRVSMVHQFAVNAVSGAGFSTAPNMIGRLNPVDTAPESTMGGSSALINMQQRLKTLQTQLAEPLYRSFIEPITRAGGAVANFASSTEKATSQISSMLSAGRSAAVSTRLSEILGDRVVDSREVYRSKQFEDLIKGIYDATVKGNLGEGDRNRIENMLVRAQGEAAETVGGRFNAAPNLGVVADLRRFVEEQLGSANKPMHLNVTISTTKGFNMDIAQSPEIKAVINDGIKTLTAREAGSVGR